MTFDKSFPANRPAPAVPTLPVAPSSTSFPQVNGPLPSVPVQPVNPLVTSYAGVFPQGYFGPNATQNVTVTVPMATSVAMTYLSSTYQSVSPSVNGLSITLPNPQTIPLGQQYVFKHLTTSGFFTLPILDFTGVQVGVSVPGATSIFFLESNSTAGGTWRLDSGDISRDSGLQWFSAIGQTTGTVAASGTNLSQFSFAITARYGIIGWADGTNVLVQGYDLQDGVMALGATAQLVTTGALNASVQKVDAVPLTGARLFICYHSSSAVTFRTIDINTTTLALTLNATNTIGTAVTASCDVVNSTLVYMTVLLSGAQNIESIVINSGTGACTPTSQSAFVGGGLTSIFSSTAVLSSTLAMSLTVDSYTGTNMKVTRSVLAGSTPTAGTPVAIASRRPLSTTAIAGQNNNALCLIPVSATTAYTVLQDSNGLLYGEFFTDTGSTITVTETQLTFGEASSGASSQALTMFKSQNSPRGLIMNGFGAGAMATAIETWQTVTVNGSTIMLSPTLQSPPNIANIPGFSAAVIQPWAVINARLFNGIGVIPFAKNTTVKLFFQPVACA